MDPLWPGLTDEEWEDIQWMLPPPKKKPFFRKRRRGGRPRASDKKAFEALLWALGGGTLERLPARFAARRTACRRLATWFPPALLDRMWHRHCSRMTDEQADDWRAVFAVKKRRPFWQQLMIAAFRVARNDH